jgi:adenosylcobinamide-GDP ribazoletransferase
MLHDFFLALGFFTRLPVPNHPNFSDAALRRSAIYFPLVGVIVGGLLALTFVLVNMVFSTSISVLITLAVGFLITGGFHEDGWADTADGLGGAFRRGDKLRIMTDSRLGTYGSLALWAMLTLKAVTLMELLPLAGWLVLLVTHALSRWAAMSAMVWLDYVRAEPSKAKPVVSQLSVRRWLASALFVLPTLVWLPPLTIACLLTASLLMTLLWHGFLKRQLGGYTGDTLGASQQLNELGLLLVWLALV